MRLNKSKKNVIFVSPYSNGLRGPMEKYAFQMITALEKLNIMCSVLQVKIKGVNYLGRLILPLFSSRRLLYCKEKVIYVHYAFFINFFSLWPFLLISKLFGKKIVIQIHEYRKYLPLRYIVKWFDLLYCLIADVIVVHNYDQYQTLLKYGFKNIELIYMPTDNYTIIPSYSKISNNTINILMHGGIIRKKGYEIGIKALSLLPDNYIMTIVGANRDYIYFKELSSLVKKLKLDNRVFIINKFLPEDEYEKIIIKSDILIYPYLISTASAALAEGALKFEKPFIASDIESFVNYIGEGNCFFESGNYIDLSKKILNLNKKESINLSIRLKKIYSWQNMGKKILNILNSL